MSNTLEFLTQDPRLILSKTKGSKKVSVKHSESRLTLDPYLFLQRVHYLGDIKSKTVSKSELEVIATNLNKELDKALSVDILPDSVGNWYEYQRATASQIRQITALHDLIVSTLKSANEESEFTLDADLTFLGIMDNPLIRKNAILSTMFGSKFGTNDIPAPHNTLKDKAEAIAKNMDDVTRQVFYQAVDQYETESRDRAFSEGLNSSASTSYREERINTMMPPLGSKHVKGMFLSIEVDDFKKIYPNYIQPFINLTELCGIKDLVSTLMSEEWCLLTLDAGTPLVGYSSMNSVYPMMHIEGRIMSKDRRAFSLEICLGVLTRVPRPTKYKDSYDLQIRSTTLSPYVLVIDE